MYPNTLSLNRLLLSILQALSVDCSVSRCWSIGLVNNCKRSRFQIPPSVWCSVVQEDIVSSLPSTGSTQENVTEEAFKPSSKIFLQTVPRRYFLWIICVIYMYVLCLSCFRVCSLLPCGHQLGKG